MHRVLVIGISGAGKSTFARALAARRACRSSISTRNSGSRAGCMTPRAEWRAKVAELAAGERWIMDGNYDSSLDLRLPRADTVLWFDYPTLRCLRRALWRVADHATARCARTWRPAAPNGSTGVPALHLGRSTAKQRPQDCCGSCAQFGAPLDPVVFRRDGDVGAFPSRAFRINLRSSEQPHAPCPPSAPPAACAFTPAPDVRSGGGRGALSRVPAAVRGAGRAVARARRAAPRC